MTMDDKIRELADKRAELHEGGGAARLAKQRAAGLTARERVSALFDQASFQEIGLLAIRNDE